MRVLVTTDLSVYNAHAGQPFSGRRALVGLADQIAGIERRTPSVLDSLSQVPASARSRIDALLAQLKDHHPQTLAHSVRVGSLAIKMAQTLGLSRHEIFAAGVAGLLHDLGKLEVPVRILDKPGRLNEIERGRARKHVEATDTLLRGIDFGELGDVARFAGEHHEKLDGSGYPHRKREADLCSVSRVVAVADLYDALREKRSYKQGMSIGRALGIITQNADKHKLDEPSVAALKTVIARDYDNHNKSF